MKPDREETILKAQREFVSYVLTVAESSLHPSQFDAFKRLVLDQFHASLKPVVLQSLSKEQTRPGRDATTVQTR